MAAKTKFFRTKKTIGSLSIPWRTRSARPRTLPNSMITASAKPSTSDVTRSVSPCKGSGMKPVLNNWKAAGNGPTEEPCNTANAKPLKTNIPANVTMNDGIL